MTQCHHCEDKPAGDPPTQPPYAYVIHPDSAGGVVPPPLPVSPGFRYVNKPFKMPQPTCHHCEALPDISIDDMGDIHCFSCLVDYHPDRALMVLDYLVNFKRLGVPRPGRAAEKREAKRRERGEA